MAVNLARSSQMTDLSSRGNDGNFTALDELDSELKTVLWELSDALSTRYLTNIAACRFTTS